MGLFDFVKGKDREPEKVPEPEEFQAGRIYDYDTPESRVATAEWLFQQAKDERTAKEAEWKKYNDYYNFLHYAAEEAVESLREQGILWTPAVVPDPYIMVESQIVPEVPQPEFHGRDTDQDSKKAKDREFAVRYILEANRINDMNPANERRLRKMGDAFWKAYYDETMNMGDKPGNIRIKDVPLEDIYPDPTAGKDGLQEGEYVVYVYTMHKLKFWRIFHKELEEKGLNLEDIVNQQYREKDGLLDPYTEGSLARDDLVQIMEFWFKQPKDTEEAKAGDIACTLQAGGVEIRYIPNYWEKTGEQCKLFPFVHYWCIRDETQFWNKGELEPILLTVDAADREIAIGQFNDAMMANDIVLVEEGALAPGSEFTNSPGSQVTVRQGRINSVARLGGLADGVKTMSMTEFMLNQIQRTNRNYDSNNGRETARVSTASGLLQLRSDAEAQQKLKKADRDSGFCRLYELLDWLALEFFDDDRTLFIGAKKKGEEPRAMKFDSKRFAEVRGAVTDLVSGEVLQEESTYFPRVDVTVTAGDGLGKNPATTVEVLDKLAAAEITEDNWELLAAELEYLDIPQKQDIIDRWKRKFAPKIPVEVTAALENDPVLLETVMEVIQIDAAAEQAAEVMANGGAVDRLPPEIAAMIPQEETVTPAAVPAQQVPALRMV